MAKCLCCRGKLNLDDVVIVTCPCCYRFVHPECQIFKSECPHCKFPYHERRAKITVERLLTLSGVIKTTAAHPNVNSQD